MDKYVSVQNREFVVDQYNIHVSCKMLKMAGLDWKARYWREFPSEYNGSKWVISCRLYHTDPSMTLQVVTHGEICQVTFVHINTTEFSCLWDELLNKLIEVEENLKVTLL